MTDKHNKFFMSDPTFRHDNPIKYDDDFKNADNWYKSPDNKKESESETMTKEQRKNKQMAYLILAIDTLITIIGAGLASLGLIDADFGASLILFLFATISLYMILGLSARMRSNDLWNDIRKETALAISLCIFSMVLLKYLLTKILLFL